MANERHIAAPELPESAAPRIRLAPGGFALTNEDNLRLTSFNALAGVQLTLTYRFLQPNGSIIVASEVHTPASDRSATRSRYVLGAGILLNLTVIVSTGSPILGQTFCRIEVIRGLTATALLVGTLVADNVTAVQALGWPGGTIRSSLDGPGYPRLIIDTQPAAGADVVKLVPVGARWAMLAFTSTLTTGIGVANRRAHFSFDQTPTAYALLPMARVQIASASVDYFWAAGCPSDVAYSNTAELQSMLVGPNLLAGTSFGTLTANLQAADQWTGVRYFVHEWLEGS